MAEQLHLPIGKVRASDPVTSHLAAHRVNVGSWHAVVLVVLAEIGTGTAEEITDYARSCHGRRTEPSKVATRLRELEALGLVTWALADDGSPALRDTSSLRLAHVWTLTGAGRMEVAA